MFNLIRGLSPIPSSNAILFDNEIKILESKLNEKDYNHAKDGEIVEINKEGIVVSCGSGSIILTKIKPFGKKLMDARSYANGIHDQVLLGQVFH